MKRHLARLILMVAVGSAKVAVAAEPTTLATFAAPPPIAADEPRATTFSPALAARSLDNAALDWQQSHACTSCHTMLPYLMARPALGAVSPQSPDVRRFFEEVAAGNRDPMPDYSCQDLGGAVVIGVAVAMAMNDRATTGALHPLTREMLDRVWTLQRPDGGWDWPFRDTPPLKVNRHYGATLAVIAVGMAPDDYADAPAARAGLQGARRFLRNTPAVTLHERAMTLWASAFVDDLLPPDARLGILSELLDGQRPDGGWSLATLVDNTSDPSLADTDRVAKAKADQGYGTEFLVYAGPDRNYQSSLDSDGYATGFVIFVLRQAGFPAGDLRLQRGIEWLKTNQRQSGRWFTPSQAWHTQHLISNAGSAYAVLALQACGQIPSPRRAELPGR